MKIFSKELVVSLLTVTVSGFMGITNANAQEFTVQGDLVSSYVWRGMYQTGASFQPTLAFSVGGFSLTAWGSTDFDGYASTEGMANKEIDVTNAFTTDAQLAAADVKLLIHLVKVVLLSRLPIFGGQVKDVESILTLKVMKRLTILRLG